LRNATNSLTTGRFPPTGPGLGAEIDFDWIKHNMQEVLR
jgi:hypothetical protein